MRRALEAKVRQHPQVREASLNAIDALRRWSFVVTIAALLGIAVARLASP